MPQQAHLPRLIWDRHQLVDAGTGGIQLPIVIGWESFDAKGLSDGPAAENVRVDDVDESTNTRRAGARWLPRGVGKNTGRYDLELPHEDDLEAFLAATDQDAFLQVSPFATVLHTIRFFESPDALGRPLTWAFPAPQLRIVPRARREANARYRRESGSLEFGYFAGRSGRTVHTALSHDIVVHETAHAILDGVAPDLYHATRTESLALHEAIADFAAIVLTLLNETVISLLYNQSSSALDLAGALSKFAEEFGSEAQTESGVDALRVLKHRRPLADLADPTDHYAVGEVLSGAAYQVFVYCANGAGMEELSLKQTLSTERGTMLRELFADTGIELPAHLDHTDQRWAIAAAKDVARFFFRALDYLPPGEASLIDFARAAVASSRAVHRGRVGLERWFDRELVERGLIRDASDLDDPSGQLGRVLGDVSCEELLRDQQAAQAFAERHRELLGIPPAIPFTVRPRRARARSRGRKGSRDLVFQAVWETSEAHDVGFATGPSWLTTVGTTLVLDWDTGRVLSLLSTEAGTRAQDDRRRTLQAWVEQGLLREAGEGADRQMGRGLWARRSPSGTRVSGSVGVLCH